MRDNRVIVETGATSEEARIISRVNGIGSPRNKGINGRNHYEQGNRTVTFVATAITEILPLDKLSCSFSEEKFQNNVLIRI